ncbi:uncharacterized protein LOC108737858 isoform X1 [Agrilus planipennis]|uniref:Uncharacterized protein LOC108737858 isoform X1 n=1 Tax=Agrilus planipennis TaxID=224129 RepID=A0A1W4WRF3_AGRPL|nr:uncharacterized protein LOC108737858 isoform X1 [Agrilus planipennis]
MFKQLFTISFLALITYCYSQSSSLGQCSDRTNIKPVENFDFVRYVADGQRKYTVRIHNAVGDCQYMNLNLTSNVTANLHWERKSLPSGTRVVRDGVVTWAPASGTRDGIISVKYPNVNNSLVYIILGIDYDEYSIGYRCVDLDASRIESIWVRSNNMNYTSQQAAVFNQILSDNGLSDLALTDVVQDPARCSP